MAFSHLFLLQDRRHWDFLRNRKQVLNDFFHHLDPSPYTSPHWFLIRQNFAWLSFLWFHLLRSLPVQSPPNFDSYWFKASSFVDKFNKSTRVIFIEMVKILLIFILALTFIVVSIHGNVVTYQGNYYFIFIFKCCNMTRLHYNFNVEIFLMRC